MFGELERLHDDGAAASPRSPRSAARSPSATAANLVVIDPIDGSLNARRTLPSFALSVAVATGPSMADVELGYVWDFGADEEFVAEHGARRPARRRGAARPRPGYGLEVVGLEATKPELIAPIVAGLEGKAYRLRGIGSLALTVSYVAAGRLDGMLSGRPSRSVDVAAAQLIAREAGASVEFVDVGLERGPPRPRRQVRDRRRARRGDARHAARDPARGRARRDRRTSRWSTGAWPSAPPPTLIAGLPRMPGGDPPPTRRRTSRPRSRRPASERSAPRPPTRASGDVESPPAPELIERREWARTALASLSEAARPVEARVAAELDLPGPLGGPRPPRRRAPAIGIEAGLAAGYAAKRVLGQYDVALFGAERPAASAVRGREPGGRPGAALERRPRALPALGRAARVHARDPVRARRLARAAPARARLAADRRRGARASTRPRSGASAAGSCASRGRVVARGAARRARPDALRPDAPWRDARPAPGDDVGRSRGTPSTSWTPRAAELGPDLGRASPAARGPPRAARRALGDLLARLLGLELKLRQYRLGKAFCDGVVDEAGPEALRLVWRSPEDLPDLDELEAPASAGSSRVAVHRVASRL